MRLSSGSVLRGFPERSCVFPESGGFSFAGAASGPHFDGVADQIISGSGQLSEPWVADGEAIFHHGFSGMSDVFQLILVEHAKAGVACGVIAAVRR